MTPVIDTHDKTDSCLVGDQAALGMTADARELLDQVVMEAVLPALSQDTDAVRRPFRRCVCA